MSRYFGELIQVGYVVHDIEAAMRHWATVLGVGPWFFLPRLAIQEWRYRGQPCKAKISLALAQEGPIQIELIQQHNASPSVYMDFGKDWSEGVHHLGYGTYDFDAALTHAVSQGHAIEQQGITGARGPFAYFATTDARPAPGRTVYVKHIYSGTMVEIIDLAHGRAELFARIAAAAQGWDGREPIRTQLPV